MEPTERDASPVAGAEAGAPGASDPHAATRPGSNGTGRPDLSRRERRWILALVALLALLHLAPIWAFDYFPSQDGPAHVHNAGVLLEYHHPDRTAYRQYYALNLRPVPNLLGHLALAAAMAVAPPRVAEKLLVSAILLLTLAATLYLLHVMRPGPSFAWLLPFPLLFHYPLHMGFYNFSLALPIALFAIGFVLAPRDRFGPGRTLALTGTLIALYLAHIVAWVFALIACGILAVGRRRRPAHPAMTAADTGARIAPTAAEPPTGLGSGVVAAFAASGCLVAWYFLRDDVVAWLTASGLLLLGPACALAATTAPVPGRIPSPRLLPLAAGFPAVVAYAVAHSGAGLFGPVSLGPPATKRLAGIWGVDALMSYSPLEDRPAVAAAALLAALAAAILARPGREPGHPARGALGWVALAVAALYLTAPDGIAGGAYILPRIALFSLFATTVWVGAHRFHPIAERAFGLAAAAIAILFLAFRIPVYRDLDRQLRDFDAAARPIAVNSTLLALSYAPFGTTRSGGFSSFRVKPLMHAAGRIAAQKRLVLLNNYEAAHRDFPVRYRPALDPTRHLPGVHYPARFRVDLDAYPRRTGARIDYVLTWGLPTPTTPGTAPHHTRAQLEAGYASIPTPSSSAARLFVSRR